MDERTVRGNRALFLILAGILVTGALVQAAAAATFAAGDSIRTTMDVDVTANPGIPETDPPVMWKGNTGTIIGGPAEVDGNRWWRIAYDVGVSGWSPEGILEPAPGARQSPEGFDTWAESAISWARSRAGRDDWNFLCMKFVVNAFTRQEGGVAGGNADDFARSLDRFDQEPGGWRSAPRGAVIFFEGRGSNAYGHAAISLGDGQTIDALGRVGEHSMDGFAGNGEVGRYLGWAYPPDSWRPSVPPLRLTVTIHDGGVFGPPLEGVRVTGSDGSGTSFDRTSDAAGRVMIEGDPGAWHITSSGAGFRTTSLTLQVLSDGTQDVVVQALPLPSPDLLPGEGERRRGMADLPDGIGYFVIALYTGILVAPLFPARKPPGSDRILRVKQMVDTSKGNLRRNCTAVQPAHRADLQDGRVSPVADSRKVQYMSFIFHLLFK